MVGTSICKYNERAMDTAAGLQGVQSADDVAAAHLSGQ